MSRLSPSVSFPLPPCLSTSAVSLLMDDVVSNAGIDETAPVLSSDEGFSVRLVTMLEMSEVVAVPEASEVVVATLVVGLKEEEAVDALDSEVIIVEVADAVTS